ncbi:MAG: flagellar biosynthesis protein FlhB [Defluviitaleaceae bacterium]|nr:flagellar biosynthesis protein FlhB [Defluviitaleaceae bacterium]
MLKINLKLFNEEKTEDATTKKKKDARSEGQVAISQEISTAFSLIFSFFGVSLFATYFLDGIMDVFLQVFDLMPNFSAVRDVNFAVDFITHMFTRTILISLPLLIISLVSGFFISLVQVGWHPTTKPMMPKLSKINPISGFKKIFSMRAILELFKSLIKLSVIGFVIYSILTEEAANVIMLMNMPVITSFMYIGALIVRLGITVGAWFIFIGAIDMAYQRFKHNKDLKMSKQEVKDEYKQSEGNPQIKGRIRQKMREVSQRRMMQDIPKADVVITNPTHYAVAIAYDRKGVSAPKVIAKGVDHLAKRIRDIAKENNIISVENVQLARALYATVDVGAEIPQELYKAVAEVLAYVYKLNNKT